MKEYISKDDIFNLLNESGITFNAEINHVLQNAPTTTKADILFDFKNDISDAIDRHNVVLLNEVNAIYRKHREVVDAE